MFIVMLVIGALFLDGPLRGLCVLLLCAIAVAEVMATIGALFQRAALEDMQRLEAILKKQEWLQFKWTVIRRMKREMKAAELRDDMYGADMLRIKIRDCIARFKEGERDMFW